MNNYIIYTLSQLFVPVFTLKWKKKSWSDFVAVVAEKNIYVFIIIFSIMTCLWEFIRIYIIKHLADYLGNILIN